MATNRPWENPVLHAMLRDTFEASLAVARIRWERMEVHCSLQAALNLGDS